MLVIFIFQISFLCSLGGYTVDEATKHMMRTVFSQKLLAWVTWKGVEQAPNRPSKLAFKSLKVTEAMHGV
jgi:hypothetical protein